MATKSHFVKKSRKPIYTTGKTFIDKKGKERLDRSVPDDADDSILVPIGSSYYWWKYRFQSKHISLTPPTSDQLRYGRYGKPEWQEMMDGFNKKIEQYRAMDEEEDGDEKQELHDEIESEVEDYKSELSDRLSSIPEPLQESSILNERIEELDDLISELND